MFKFNSVPAYSIGKSRNKQKDESLPGPGAYDTTKLINIKEKHMGTTVVYKTSKSKSKQQINDIGPGSYNVKFKDHVKGYYNGKSKGDRDIIKSKDIPGPGQYNYDQAMQKLIKSNGIAFERSKKDTGNSILPLGPGQYDTQKYTMFDGKKNAWSFKKEKHRTNKDDAGPGPGAYNYQKYYESRDSGHAYSLQKTSKFTKADFNTPGPGMYNNGIRAITSKGVYFPRSQEKHKIEDIPGPGHYNTNFDKFKTKAPGYKFTKTDNLNKLENLPGPGQYKDSRTAFTSKGNIFNKSKRYSNRIEDKPAPGQYNVPPIEKPKGLIFDKQPVRTNRLEQIPGPGQYNYKEKQQYRFALPRASNNTKTNDGPGPAQYNVKFDDWNKRVPAFDRTGRGGKENAAPIGPGHYDIPYSIPDVPKYNYPDMQHRKIHL